MYLNKGPTWREVGNLTDPGEGGEVRFGHGPLKSCNNLNCSATLADVKAVVKGSLLIFIAFIFCYKYQFLFIIIGMFYNLKG